MRTVHLAVPALAAAVVAEALPAAPPLLDPDEIETQVEQVLADRDIPGCCVGIVVGAEPAYVRSFGLRDVASESPVTPETIFQIGSVTKTFTATLLAMLRDEGLLDLDDTVAEHLPADVPVPEDPLGPPMTLRHLATHTSGLPPNPWNRRNVPDSPSVALPYSVAELHDGLAGTILQAPPGRRFVYSNFGFGLLGHTLERAGGEPYETLLTERLLVPLGMRSTSITLEDDELERFACHYWPGDEPRTARERWIFGEVSANGGLASTVPDLLRYVRLFLGTHESWRSGSPAVKASTVRELVTPQRLINETWDRALGLGWLLARDPAGHVTVAHGGEVDGHSALVAFARELGAGVVVLANVGADSAERIGRPLIEDLLEAAAARRRTAHELLAQERWSEAIPALSQQCASAPLDDASRYALATALYHAGDYAKAGEAFVEAAARGHLRPTAYYNAGCCAALDGNHDRAFRLLRLARDSGFSDRRQALTDPDLATLRDDPRWRALLNDRAR